MSSHSQPYKLVFYTIIILALVVFSLQLIRQVGSIHVISPLASEKKPPSLNFFAKPPQDLTTLVTEIKKITDKEKGMYSVYIYDISKQTGAGFNERVILNGASVNKIAILAALYFEAQTQTVDLDQRITVQPSDIQDYGTGIIRNEGPGGVYSVKTLAQLMMTKSDNTATFILSNLVDGNKIQELVTSWGLSQTDMANNKTSNQDMALLLTKMYRGQIASNALTVEMFGFMTNSDFENRLPALLPKTVSVYHKIGSEIGNLHDVGIIDAGAHPYYIGIMTNDITDEAATESVMAQVSKLVYDYMVKQ